MIQTNRGLPNTCSVCGTPVSGSWFAKNEDVARSGGGVCAKCNGKGVEQTKIHDTPAAVVEDTPVEDTPAEDYQPDIKKKSYGR
jgi:hypothetical protein